MCHPGSIQFVFKLWSPNGSRSLPLINAFVCFLFFLSFNLSVFSVFFTVSLTSLQLCFLFPMNCSLQVSSDDRGFLSKDIEKEFLLQRLNYDHYSCIEMFARLYLGVEVNHPLSNVRETNYVLVNLFLSYKLDHLPDMLITFLMTDIYQDDTTYENLCKKFAKEVWNIVMLCLYLKIAIDVLQGKFLLIKTFRLE